jgi:DMSO/TMAO reductase YedYZ molybdopterin-dependent catalytic subunit
VTDSEPREGVGAATPSDRRVLVRGHPFNAEAPLAALEASITPVADFYVRTNLGVPAIDHASWRLTVDGLVDHPLELALSDLESMPSIALTCTMECAGNNRTRLAPITEGEPWGSGAISTAVFGGVPLDAVLERAGIQPGTLEIRFEGADRGTPRGGHEEIAYERSLPVADARGNDVLLARTMNEAPLTEEHGAPLRLLVPGWYGMASVKWLRRIEALDHPLEAHYQSRQYRYYGDEPVGARGAPPVRTMRVNSMVLHPANGDLVGPGPHEVRGVAWSGDAPIAAVDVSVDAGEWQPAELLVAHRADDRERYAWRRWTFAWGGSAAGRHSIRSRATAADGSVQPDRPVWNRLGYGNNAIAITLVTVRGED